MAGAFDKVRVVDFSQGIGGPMAAMLLADHGADVIKVEGPAGDRIATEPVYLVVNRNKRRVRLDLGASDGRAAARRLIATADVVLFDEDPEKLREQGLDHESLAAEQPSLLHVCMPFYGGEGPWQELPPDEALRWSMSGSAFRQFSWSDIPVHLVTPQISYAHGMMGACAIGAALYERAHSGLGQAVVLDGMQAHAALQSAAMVLSGDPIRSRAIGTRGTLPNYKLYRCGDGEWIFVAALMMHHFELALDATDCLDVLQMEGVEGKVSNVLRRGVGGRVRQRMEERFQQRPASEWIDILQRKGVPAARLGTREEWLDSEPVTANTMRVTLQSPRGQVRMPNVALRLSETPGSVRGCMQDVPLHELLDRRPAPGTSAAPVTGGGPLHGVRILDLGAVVAAPHAVAILANLGADVIKVEPLAGDSFRSYAIGFLPYNRGKRSAVIDLKHPRGQQLFLRLVEQADVVSDNYRLGVLDRLGLGYERLRAHNPRLIAASITAYGTRGAQAHRPGFDPLLQVASGLMSAQGGVDEPVFHQIPVNDTASAFMMAFGIVAALHARVQSGTGQRVETSLTAQSLYVQLGELTEVDGRLPAAQGARDCVGVAALRRSYACADGWITLAVADARAFEALCAVLGMADLGRGRFAEAAREPVEGVLAAALMERIRERPVEGLLAALREARVPAVRAVQGYDIFEDEWHVRNGILEQHEHPRFGRVTSVRAYASLSRTPSGFPRTSPLLGEHTEEVLAAVGVSAEEVERLEAEGIVARKRVRPAGAPREQGRRE